LKKIYGLILKTLLLVFIGLTVTGCEGADLFVGTTDISTNNHWRFTARRANGQQTLTRSLNQEDLRNFTVNSTIESGEMFLILSQGGSRQTINLGGGEMTLSADDIGLDEFEPGSIRMQLDFVEARGATVYIRWR